MQARKRIEVVRDKARHHPMEEIKMPVRATGRSAAYDFFSPEECVLHPGAKHMFFTDLKVRLESDIRLGERRLMEEFILSPRSSAGIKLNLMLSNTIGLVDPDYFGCKDNDGNIGISVFNYGAETVTIKKGDRFAQGIVVLSVVDEGDEPEAERTGGMGSTGR